MEKFYYFYVFISNQKEKQFIS